MEKDEEFEGKPDELEKNEEDIYSEEGREGLMEDDEIEPWEEGFMEGESHEGQKAKCRRCGKILTSPEEVIEKEFDDEIHWFCSEECLEEYEKEQERKRKKGK